MGYITAIKISIIFFPIIALFFTIPFILSQYHKYGSINPFRTIIIYSFILYMLTIYFLVILPLPSKEELVKPTSDVIKLIPFGFIFDIIQKSSFVLTNPSTYLTALTEPVIYTVLFNIIMTIPFGMYLRYYFKCDLKKTIVYSFLLSLFFEVTQLTGLYYIYPYPYRVFDVDDLIMNTLGGFLGYYLMGICQRILPTREKIDEDSYLTGQVVSGLRRITITCLDLFLYFFLGVILKMVSVSFLSTFIIYYLFIPYLFSNQTLGSRFLKVRLEYSSHPFVKNSLRVILISGYYLVIPYFVTLFVVWFIGYTHFIIIPSSLLLISLFLFYLKSIIQVLQNKEMLYDKIVKTKYVSTIKKN